MNLELSHDLDGTFSLIYWDNLHGFDKCLFIDEKGDTFEEIVDGDRDIVLKPINLAVWLKKVLDE